MYTLEEQEQEQLKLLQNRIIEASRCYVGSLFSPKGYNEKITRENDFQRGAIWMFQNQWISVEEECPIGTCVLLDKYGNMRLDRLDFRALGYIRHNEITHWMPIPEPKKGGE